MKKFCYVVFFLLPLFFLGVALTESIYTQIFPFHFLNESDHPKWKTFTNQMRQEILPYSRQDPHPFYGKYFQPQVLGQRHSQNIYVSQAGFRGITDQQLKDNKKPLVFVIGGSSVFGYGSTRDETTLSGYLNKLDPTFLYVNAGVNGWNTTQELVRLVYQLVDYKPKSIIVMDGNNNMRSTMPTQDGGHVADEPEGMREFVRLSKLTTSIGGAFKLLGFHINHFITKPYGAEGRIKQDIKGFFRRNWPSLYAKLKQPKKSLFLTEPEQPLTSIQKMKYDDTSHYYTHTLSKIKKTCEGFKIECHFFLQPFAYLHHQFKDPEVAQYFLHSDGGEVPKLKEYEYYHKQVILKAADQGVELHDFSTLFNKYADDQFHAKIFVDRIHLYDRGEEFLAREVLKTLGRDSH